MEIYANRTFVDKGNLDLIEFYETLGEYISTNPRFGAFKLLGDELQAETALFKGFNTEVNRKDLRQIPSRNGSRKKATKIALKICDEVNLIADNDPIVYGEAGLKYKEKPSAGRPIGNSKIESVVFNMDTGRIEIRIKLADKAHDYQVDLRGPDGMITEEYGMLAGAKGSVPAPAVAGAYQIRVVPRDYAGNKGTPTAWSSAIPVARDSNGVLQKVVNTQQAPGNTQQAPDSGQ